MVGLLNAVGCGKLPLSAVEQILHSRQRTLAPAGALPHGLYLLEVSYPPLDQLASQAAQIPGPDMEEDGITGYGTAAYAPV
jgi:tRNA U38,U39,U40 pseudouridine synthase TruA